MLLESRRLKLEDNDTREIWELDTAARKRYKLPRLWESWSERYWEVAQLLHIPYLPWFRRVWIIQELALAPEAHIRYGKVEVPWEDFFMAWKYTSVELGFRNFTVFHLDSVIRGSDYPQQFASMFDADGGLIGNLTFALNDIRQDVKN